jgi:dephospho-CoA kinase
LSNWPGKTVIGLTGNIATGKSVVRRMLEHLGAYSIDADALSHRAIAKGAPAYQPVIDTFGKFVLGSDGEIDRAKLGKLVFNDPEALKQLEGIIHPMVRQAIDMLVKRAGQPVVVIEAIKLIEGPMRNWCDVIWVADAPEDVQVERLMRKRLLSREEALQRVRSQNPQKDKLAAAKVVIKNTGSYDDLWTQVSAAWKDLTKIEDTVIQPAASKGPAVSTPITQPVPPAADAPLSVLRARPRDSQAIAELVTRLSGGKKKMSADDVMEAFGERAFILLKMGDTPVGVAGWQVENLVARTIELYLAPNVPVDPALESIVKEMERASQDLQCEASLIFLPPHLAQHTATWAKLGYEQRTPEKLGVQAWQDAAVESMQPGTSIFFHQLRQDRIMRPI